jgi:putative transposase
VRNKRRQLKNLVNELHWKSIKYLTEQYDKILIGDLSAKRISSKETSNIPKMTKRIALSMSYYKFRQRLEYKCKIKGIDYRVVDEKYTSKMCCVCGSYNEKLGGSKIYKCVNSKCNIKVGRDDGGAHNIFMLETI